MRLCCLSTKPLQKEGGLCPALQGSTFLRGSWTLTSPRLLLRAAALGQTPHPGPQAQGSSWSLQVLGQRVLTPGRGSHTHRGQEPPGPHSQLSAKSLEGGVQEAGGRGQEAGTFHHPLLTAAARWVSTTETLGPHKDPSALCRHGHVSGTR